MGIEGTPDLPEDGAAEAGDAARTPVEHSLLLALTETIPDAVYYKDLESRFLWGNRALARALGLTDPSEAIGKTDCDFFDPIHATESCDDEQEIIETGLPLVAKRERERSLAGEWRWVSTTKIPVRDASGNVIGTAGISRDIDAEVHNEEALRESEARFRALADSLPALVSVLGPDQSIVYVNQAVLDFYGAYSGEDLRGAWQDALHPEDAERILHGPLPPSDASGLAQREYRLRRHDGQYRWVLEFGMPRLTPASGADAGQVVCAIDITERREAQEARDRLEEQLEKARRLESLGVLAGGIAHDINNALAVVLGCAEQGSALPDGPDADNRASVLFERIRQATMRAKAIVAQVLAFGRQADPDRRTIRLQEELAGAVALARSGLPSTIALQASLSEDAPPVRANGALIQQALLNLVTNARDAITGGHGAISVDLSSVALDDEAAAALGCAPGSFARLCVSDTGCGMDAATLARVFDPFFTTKPRSAGTGLGLASVHGMVTAHGGTVTAESTPGVGSVFRIYLPAAGEADGMPADYGGASPVPRGSGRVLFLDDEPELVELGIELLTGMGYEVTGMTDPGEALRVLMAPNHGYDLLLTDQTMPLLTGLELAGKLRAAGSRLPVVLLTGYSPAVAGADLRAEGILALLAKPFAMGDLARVVGRALSSPVEGHGSGRS